MLHPRAAASAQDPGGLYKMNDELKTLHCSGAGCHARYQIPLEQYRSIMAQWATHNVDIPRHCPKCAGRIEAETPPTGEQMEAIAAYYGAN